MLTREIIFFQYFPKRDRGRSNLISQKKRQWEQQFIRGNSQTHSSISPWLIMHVYEVAQCMETEKQHLTYFWELTSAGSECVRKQAPSTTIRNTTCLEEMWLFQTLFGKCIPICLYPVLFLIGKVFLLIPPASEAAKGYVTFFEQWNMSKNDMHHFWALRVNVSYN